MLPAQPNNQRLLAGHSTFGDSNSNGDIQTNSALTTTVLPALPDGSFFRPAIQGSGYTWSSLISDNPDLVDHLVAYKITGLDPTDEANGIFTYLLGFEDLTQGDFDYNDLVVQLDFSAVRSVPEPSTLALVGAGLAVFGFARWRRKPA